MKKYITGFYNRKKRISAGGEMELIEKVHLLVRLRFYLLLLAGGFFSFVFIAGDMPYLVIPWLNAIFMGILANVFNLWCMKKDLPLTDQIVFQFRADIILLTILVHYTGGLGSPVIPGYFFLLFIYSLFITQIKLIRLTLEIVLFFTLTVFAEYHHWLTQFVYVKFQRVLYKNPVFVASSVILADLTLMLISFFLGTMSSIIEKNRAMVRKSDTFQRKLIEHIGRGVITLDNEGYIATVNQYVMDLYSLKEDDIIGCKIDGLFKKYHKDTRLGDEIIRACRDKKNVGYDDIRTQLVGGEEISLFVKGIPLVEIYLLLLEDTSSRVRMQEKMLQTDKLASIGLLAAGLAHEINNPLSGISSTIQNLAKQETDGRKKHYFHLMQKEIIRVTDLLKRLLNYSRSSDNKLRSDSFYVKPFLDETLSLFEYAFKRQRIEVRIDPGNTASYQVKADPSEIKQVVINLIQNAIQAMQRGGILSITVRDNPGDSTCSMSFSDTGVGIKEEYLEHIFEPFFTTKEDDKGTGLGLAVSHSIVKKYGGELTAHRNPGKGVSFTLTLRIKK